MKNNGFSSEEQYLEAFEKIKNIQEANDTYDRDTIALYKEEDYVELVVDEYNIQFWGEDIIEADILNEKGTLVDNGIIKVCEAILEALRDGDINFNN